MCYLFAHDRSQLDYRLQLNYKYDEISIGDRSIPEHLEVSEDESVDEAVPIDIRK